MTKELGGWLGNLRTGTLYIEPGSPWENGYCESLNGKLRDECLNGELFHSLREAQVVIEKWRVEYNARKWSFVFDNTSTLIDDTDRRTGRQLRAVEYSTSGCGA